MLSPHHRPKSYVDAVLTTMGGISQATPLPLAQVALPLPAIDGQLRTARQRANLVVVLANAMAPGLPIHRSNFFASGNIGLALPTNLL
jgi:hypothetical protein